MKNFSVFLASVIGFCSTGFAANRLCPSNTTEIQNCVAANSIPAFPFVSICRDNSGSLALIVDEGVMGSPEAVPVKQTGNAQQTVWQETDVKRNATSLTVYKPSNQAAVTKATLNIDIGTGLTEFKYNCKVQK